MIESLTCGAFTLRHLEYWPTPNVTPFSRNYLSSEAEAAFGLHHLLQDVALDSSGADVFIDDAVLQVNIIDRHADQRQVVAEGQSVQPVVCGSQRSTVSVCALHQRQFW